MRSILYGLSKNKVCSTCLFNYLPIACERTDGVMYFLRALARIEIQTTTDYIFFRKAKLSSIVLKKAL